MAFFINIFIHSLHFAIKKIKKNHTDGSDELFLYLDSSSLLSLMMSIYIKIVLYLNSVINEINPKVYGINTNDYCVNHNIYWY
jgi:hypothetical protein